LPEYSHRLRPAWSPVFHQMRNADDVLNYSATAHAGEPQTGTMRVSWVTPLADGVRTRLLENITVDRARCAITCMRRTSPATSAASGRCSDDGSGSRSCILRRRLAPDEAAVGGAIPQQPAHGYRALMDLADRLAEQIIAPPHKRMRATPAALNRLRLSDLSGAERHVKERLYSPGPLPNVGLPTGEGEAVRRFGKTRAVGATPTESPERSH